MKHIVSKWMSLRLIGCYYSYIIYIRPISYIHEKDETHTIFNRAYFIFLKITAKVYTIPCLFLINV